MTLLIADIGDELTLIVPIGDITMKEGGDEFVAAVKSKIAAGRNIIVDLGNVKNHDFIGLHGIVSTVQSWADKRLRLMNIPDGIRGFLDSTKLSTIVTEFKSQAEALALRGVSQEYTLHVPLVNHAWSFDTFAGGMR